MVLLKSCRWYYRETAVSQCKPGPGARLRIVAVAMVVARRLCAIDTDQRGAVETLAIHQYECFIRRQDELSRNVERMLYVWDWVPHDSAALYVRHMTDH